MNPKLQLHIPTPCHENWNAMTPQAQGRFCNACAKVVVDFSMMTDKEVLDYMNTATSNVCGRMSTEQLAKPLQAYPATRSFGWKYMWSLLVGSFLMTAKSYAQGKVVAQKPKTTQLPPVIRMGAVAYTQPDKKSVPVKLEGVVVDENGQPISFASVIIKGTTKGTMANEKGFFSMPVSKINSNDNLMISAVGYEALHITVGSGIAEIKKDSSNEAYAILNFKMVTMKGQLLGEVVVVGYGTDKKKNSNTAPRNSKLNGAVQQATPSVSMDAYNEYLDKNKRVPESLLAVHGDVVLSFEINNKGVYKDFVIEKSLQPQLDAEAIRLVKEGPSWKLVAGRKTRASVIVRF